LGSVHEWEIYTETPGHTTADRYGKEEGFLDGSGQADYLYREAV